MLSILGSHTGRPTDRQVVFNQLREAVVKIVGLREEMLAIELIVTTVPHLYSEPEGFADLLVHPSTDVRAGYRHEADYTALLDSLFVDFPDRGLNLLLRMTRERPSCRTAFNLVALRLVELERYREALAFARAAFQAKQNCVYTEDVLRAVLVPLCAGGIPEDLRLSDIEMALMDSHEEFFCPKAFNNFEVYRTGEVFMCCGSLLPASIGNVFDQPFDQIWNSETAQAIRESIHDGSFRYCSRTCTSLRGRGLPLKAELEQQTEDPREKRLLSERLTVLDDGPTLVNLAHDYTCNLSCPSCRRTKLSADSKRREVLDIVFDRGIKPLLPFVKNLQIAGDGDPFASKHYRQILAELSIARFPELRLKLLTNGVLLDANEWAAFSNIHPLLAEVSVSVDAATPETYAIVRRGGDWNRLERNLEHLGCERAKGVFPVFSLNFVVQQLNYREMPAFVEMGRRLGADRLDFQPVHNQTEAFARHEFQRAEVTHPLHSEYPDLQRVLRDPLLNDPIVNLCFNRDAR
ncbi:MAG: SPASM domain-containing protein [Bdellovibrionota bacterium]